MSASEYEEGDKCPECGEGLLIFPEVENCACHIYSPCNAHIDNALCCDICYWEPCE